MRKDVKEFIATLRQLEDVTVERSRGGNHWTVRDKGARVSMLPSTPSDYRWRRNAIMQMKAGGLDINTRAKRSNGRAAGGEPPPPLPVIPTTTRRDRMADVTKVTDEALLGAATALAENVREHYGLQVRKGRVTAHGLVPKLTEVAFAYAKSESLEVPHLNYTKRYDVNDAHEMCRLAANRLSDAVALQQSEMTLTTQKQLTFLVDAWNWFRKRGYKLPEQPKAEPGWEQVVDQFQDTTGTAGVTAEETAKVPWLPPRPAEMDRPLVLASENGDRLDLALEVATRLAAGGEDPADAALLGRKVYEAVR